ncbi:MAG: hypothetical protein HRU15_09120 [Planctomycetes bacterium]|nr:hypothetical protein [Planctomycetota bacterium]
MCGGTFGTFGTFGRLGKYAVRLIVAGNILFLSSCTFFQDLEKKIENKIEENIEPNASNISMQGYYDASAVSQSGQVLVKINDTYAQVSGPIDDVYTWVWQDSANNIHDEYTVEASDASGVLRAVSYNIDSSVESSVNAGLDETLRATQIILEGNMYIVNLGNYTFSYNGSSGSIASSDNIGNWLASLPLDENNGSGNVTLIFEFHSMTTSINLRVTESSIDVSNN